MKNLFYTCLLLFSSCTVFKHKIENSSSQKDLIVHNTEQKDSAQLTALSRHIRLLSDDRLEMTEIIPAGRFIYSPDSGFTGKATRVRVYRQTLRQSVEKDTIALHSTANSYQESTDSTLHRQAHRQTDEQTRSKPASLWKYALAAMALLLLALARKKR